MYPKKLVHQVIRRPDYPVAETYQGKVRGSLIDGTFVFRGIPYASARRFHWPRRAENWEGIRDAIVYGCTSPELDQGIPQDEHICPHYFLRADEHCQFLNIWTPTLDPEARLPVMVWFHGGGWTSGSSIEQFAYDGENFSKFANAVVVNFNSRQNCLGFLDLSAFGEEYKDSGLAGFGDVLLAMEWIHENIACFGGSPDKVTAVGQAGGGKKALSLMQSPAADGLYSQMAIGSCAGERMELPDGWSGKQAARRMGELTAEQLGLTKETISRIETIPWDQLREAVKRAELLLKREIPDRFRWDPVPDGEILFEDPFYAGFREETRGIPMMMGSSFSEMMGNTRVQIGDGRKNEWSLQQVAAFAAERYGSQSEKILAEFSGAYPDHRLADALFIDQRIRPRLNRLALQRAADGEKVWDWVFHLESPVDGGLTAWHCSDTPFVLQNTGYIEGICVPGTTDVLEKRIGSAWKAFIWNGDPNCSELPDWPAASGDSLPVMMFGKECQVRIDPEKEMYRLMVKKEKS